MQDEDTYSLSQLRLSFQGVVSSAIRSNAAPPSHSSVHACGIFFAYFTSTSLSIDRSYPSRTTHYNAFTGGLMEEGERVRP